MRDDDFLLEVDFNVVCRPTHLTRRRHGRLDPPLRHQLSSLKGSLFRLLLKHPCCSSQLDVVCMDELKLAIRVFCAIFDHLPALRPLLESLNGDEFGCEEGF
jgi:hypothetical protein